jgi:hypothetical protein
MKKIFILSVVTASFFIGCKKNQSTTPSAKHLFANAGSDTTICLTYGGFGDLYKGILNGRASHDDAGKIISYTWKLMGDTNLLYPYPQTNNFSNDSTPVTFFYVGQNIKFNLEVRDDQGRIDNDQVTMNINLQFSYEYDGLSWDSTIGSLTTISVKYKPGFMEVWPDSVLAGTTQEVYLVTYTGACFDVNSWTKLHYVSYDSIQLTQQPLFYSLVPGPSSFYSQGALYPEIYGRTNSGFDFTQKLSVGINVKSPWDY